MNRRKAYDKEYVQAQVMDYLEEKYHEKFLIKSYSSSLGDWFGNYVQVGICPEGKDDKEHYFYVWGNLNDEGNLEYEDAYVSVLMEEKLLKYFEPVINEYFDNCRYEMDLSPTMKAVSNKIPGNVTVGEFLDFKSGEDYMIPILCIYSEQKLEEETERILCRKLQLWKF